MLRALFHVGTALSFYFSEIIIRSNVNLITSNLQLSYWRSWVGAASPGWQGPNGGALGGKLNI